MTRLKGAAARKAGNGRYALLLGAGVVLALGVSRGTVQAYRLHTAHRWVRLALTMMAVSAIWLPVPALFEWIGHRAGRAIRAGLWSVSLALLAVLEPLYTLFAMRHMRVPVVNNVFANVVLRLDTNLLICGAIVAALVLRASRLRWMAATAAAIELRARTRQAEVGVLTMQLQPHFLFNTLNLISQLAFESADRAKRALRDLRELLLTSVENGSRGAVTLAEELRFLEAYLDVQRLRFGSRLDARVMVDPLALDAAVPPMLLQPLVENGIRHGFGRRASGGEIRVGVRRLGAQVEVEVSDDGVGFVETSPHEGVGLSNVRHRMEQFFGDDAQLAFATRPGGGAVVRLTFPVTPLAAVLAPEKPAPDADSIEADRLPPLLESRMTRAGLIAAGWMFVAAVWTELVALASSGPGSPASLALNFAWNGLNAGVWLVLTPVVIWVTDRLVRYRVMYRAAGHVIAGAMVAFTHLFLTGLLMSVVLHSTASDIHAVRIGWAVWDLIAYFLLVLFTEALAVKAQTRERAAEMARTRERLANTRVSLLRLQLQPDLLVAGLDAVERAIPTPELCEAVIARLGDVLRRLLAVAGDEESTVGEETAMLRSYLELSGEALTLVLESVSDLDARIPAVFLLPLADAIGGGHIRLHTSRIPGGITLELLAQGAQAAANGERLGILEQRLAALYGPAASIHMVCRGDAIGVRVDFTDGVVGARAPEMAAVA
jgi:LytS/YehU family sensor histidine kinase